jgi:hypothetical protein
MDYTPITSEQLTWVLLDFDKTLCGNGVNYIPEAPTESAVESCKKIVSLGLKPIIWTARHWGEFRIVKNWVKNYGLPIETIICGKPLGLISFDDRNVECDTSDYKGSWARLVKKCEDHVSGVHPLN